MRYRNKHIIITGGSTGIGLALARIFSQEGAHLTIIARDQAKLYSAKLTIEEARSFPAQKVLTFSVDVTDQARLEEALQSAMNELGAPDVLITSAGTSHPGYFLEIPTDIFKYSMDLNYLGTLYAVRAVLPAMTQQQRGQIILISSGAALIGVFGYTSYSPTKFALRGLAESLRAELRPQGIKVAIAYPPDTATPLLDYENQTKPRETKEIAATAKTWSAEAVAKVIVKGIRKGSFSITPGLAMTLLAKLNSFIVPFLNVYFDRIVTRVQRQQTRRPTAQR